MLTKIMKYEWRAAGRTLWPLAILTVALGGLLRGAIWLAPKINDTAGEIVLVLAESFAPMIASVLLFAYAIVLTVRFYQSLSADEAYLSFTLPVKVSTHLFARLWVACGYTAIFLIATALFSLIATPSVGDTLSEIWKVLPLELPLSELSRSFPAGSVLVINHGMVLLIGALLALLLFIAQVCSVLQLYASVAIGTQFGRSRAIGSVVAYFVSNLLQGIATLVVAAAVCVPLFISRVESASYGYEDGWWLIGFFALIIGIIYLVTVLFGIAYFLFTKHLFTKKLNLE